MPVMLLVAAGGLLGLYLLYQLWRQDDAEDAGRATVARLSGLATGGIAVLLGAGFEVADALGSVGDLLAQATTPILHALITTFGAAGLAGVIPLDAAQFVAISVAVMLVGVMVRN
jgi:hypothetical protein